jgi:hypothetical protein
LVFHSSKSIKRGGPFAFPVFAAATALCETLVTWHLAPQELVKRSRLPHNIQRAHDGFGSWSCITQPGSIVSLPAIAARA